MVVAVVVTGRLRAAACVLVRTVLEHHPDAHVVLCTLRTTIGRERLPAGVEVLDADELLPDLPLLGAEVVPEDLPGALAPYLLERLLGEADLVVHLGPPNRVLAPLDALVLAARDGLAVVPVARDPLAQAPPTAPFDPQAFAVGGDAGRRLVRTWREALEGTAPPYDTRGPLGTWLAQAAGRRVVADVATHLAERPEEDRVGERDGGLVVGGRPRALLRLDGFEPQHPSRLGGRPMKLGEPLDAIVVAHAAELLEAGAEDDTSAPTPFLAIADGTVLDRRLRGLFRRGRREGALRDAPFGREGGDAFVAWLSAPASRGAQHGLLRYHEAIWAENPDLRAAYPDLDADGEGLAGWLWRFAGPEIVLPAHLMPPLPAGLKGQVRGEPPWGVNVAGFFTAELGLGEAARLLIAGLDAGRVPALPVQGEVVPDTRQGAEFQVATPDDAPFGINILCLNGDAVLRFAQTGGERLLEGRHNIALWWWEVDVFPEDWRRAFDHLDEVWVASDHIHDVIAPVSPVPVHKVDLPVVIPDVPPADRSKLGIPADRFAFLFVWDYHSTEQRKNPSGLVEAFTTAFPEPRDDGPVLVLKCINHRNRPEQHAKVLDAIGGRDDVVLIDRFLDAVDKDGLFGACDAYVSLHRSEGFGLTVAEAMWCGKPVVATRYGGVLEFLDDDNAFLVDHGMTTVGPDALPYPPQARWAEPDLGHAAQLMREVVERPELARERAERAAQDIRTRHSPAAIGPRIADRLREVHARQRDDEGRHSIVLSSVPALPLPARTMIDEAPSGLGGPGLRGRAARAARRGAAGLLRPLLAQGRHVDAALVDAVERLDERLRALVLEADGRRAADHAQSLAAFRRLRAQLHGSEARLGWLEGAARPGLLAELDQHLAEHRSLPYTDGDTQGVVEHERFGEVLAFTADGRADAAVYRSFEDVFRGTEERVRELQRVYVDLLAPHAPVLDVGCGRGELLDLLRDAGVRAAGVDLDEGMVERCRAKGHADVRLGDAVEALTGSGDGAYGAVFSAQVVEHLPYDVLLRFLAEGRRALREGGVLVAETVNPHAVHAMKAFWVDPTHQHPLFPEVLLELCRISGFREGFVLHPNGTGDLEADRRSQPAYAVVATR